MKRIRLLNKSDRKVLAALAIMVVAAIGILTMTGRQQTNNRRLEQVYEQPTNHRSSGHASQQPVYAQKAEQAERFAFDPNTADSTQLLRLGL
jgi:hypothetical protein